MAVDLTEKGEANLPAIQEVVFSFLALLRQRTNGNGQSGIPAYVYEECKTLADIAWKFQVRMGSRMEISAWTCVCVLT